MIKALYRRLNHCNDLAVRISKANTAQLQQLKAELAELIGTPPGCYTMGIPAVLSTLGVIVSFGIPQLWLGYKVSAALGQPEENVFIWVVLIALLFSGINGMTMFLIGKGLMRAVQVHLTGGYEPCVNDSLSADCAKRCECSGRQSHRGADKHLYAAAQRLLHPLYFFL